MTKNTNKLTKPDPNKAPSPLYLHPQLKQVFSASPDLFQTLAKLPGKIYSIGRGRETKRVEIGHTGYFIKRHTGVGWLEILKNFCFGRLPILGADTEFHAIAKLHDIGLKTMTVRGFGQRGLNPARRQSFLITEEILGTESLDVLSQAWPDAPPAPAFKRALIACLARVVSTLHQQGLNHRDCYLCHFRLPLELQGVSDPKQLDLYVMDLHRCQMRACVPKRWLIKDLGSLYFSALQIGLSKRDYLRFIKAYSGLPLREALTEQKPLWQAVQQRCKRLQQKHLPTVAFHE